MWLRSKESYSDLDFENIYTCLIFYKNYLYKEGLRDISLEELICKISKELGR